MKKATQREIDQAARRILVELLEVINTGQQVTFQQDMGEATATLLVGNWHTHVGCPGESFDHFVEDLHGALVSAQWENA